MKAKLVTERLATFDTTAPKIAQPTIYPIMIERGIVLLISIKKYEGNIG